MRDMRSLFRRTGVGSVLLLWAGCAISPEQQAAQFIAEMDAGAPENRVPNWDATRALMMRRVPQVGEPAPDFELKSCRGDARLRLSEWQGRRPVVLIFGSWT